MRLNYFAAPPTSERAARDPITANHSHCKRGISAARAGFIDEKFRAKRRTECRDLASAERNRKAHSNRDSPPKKASSRSFQLYFGGRVCRTMKSLHREPGAEQKAI